MTIATTIINEALTLIGVASPISPPEPEQQATAFSVLKDLFNLWTKDEVSLGLSATVPATIASDIAEDAWATGPLKALLAEALCPYFRIEPSMRLNKLIAEAHESILIHGAPDVEPYYPGNMPLGQGNASPFGPVYYPEPEID